MAMLARPPSWIDRSQAWVDRRSIPPWSFYLLLTAGVALLSHLARWLDGSLRPGSPDIGRFAEAPIVVYFFATMHYLNRAARDALASFRPALSVTEQEYSELESKLVMMPRPIALWSTLAGVVLGITSVRSGPVSWGLSPTAGLVTTALVHLLAATILAGAVLFVAHTVRQMQLVDGLQGLARNVSIFQRGSLYAFSGLTFRAAISLLAVTYYYLFLNFYFQVFSPEPALSTVDAFTLIVAVAIAVALFVLPVLRTHRRLVEERAHLVAEADRRYATVFERFNRQVDAADYRDLEPTTKALAGLAVQRETLARLSTWPWRPDTLRSFVTSVALPVLLLLISAGLRRMLGL